MDGMTRGERNIKWIESFCCVPEGRLVGEQVALTETQKDWIKQIYDSQTRLFILSIPRKNAKTTFSAFLLLLHLVGPEAKPNSQLFSAAQSREQAAILFSLAAKMVRMSPDLAAFITVRDSGKQLACQELGTLYRALSAEASTAYGLSPAFTVHDELGQVRGPRSNLYDALETAAGAQESPLSIVISTQAPTDGDLLSTLIDDAKSENDPAAKAVVHSAPLDADPFSEETIRQANPHFDVFMNREEVLRQMEQARRMPSKEASFRNLILNQRVDQTTPFITRAAWEATESGIDENAFVNGVVFAGLDLSARNDLTALALVTKYKSLWHCKVEFFAPRIGLNDRAMRDRAPYDVWAEQGWLSLTSGASVAYDEVAERLIEICDDYSVEAIAFDRWRIDVLQAELNRRGVELPLEPFGQGYRDMSPALEYLESELLNEGLTHDENPLLKWCAANAISVADTAGNRKLDKQKSSARIDGVQALAMAFGQASKTQIEEKKPMAMFMLG